MARSAKKKPEKVSKSVSFDGWQQCHKCDILISSDDAETHLKECSNDEPSLEEFELSFLDSNASSTLHQSFIKDEIFFGEIGALHAKHSELISSMFMKEWENIVLLNPSTMRKCNILSKNYVIVKGKHHCCLYIAYPLRFVRYSALVFPKNNAKFKMKEKVVLQSYKELVRDAVQIVVSCKKKLRVNAELIQLILGKLYKTFVSVGMKVEITSFGCTYLFTIKTIHGNNPTTFLEPISEILNETESSNVGEIGDICDLSSLNINDSLNLNISNLSYQVDSPSTTAENQQPVLFSTPQSTGRKLKYNLSNQEVNFSNDFGNMSLCEQMTLYFRVSPTTVLTIDQDCESSVNNSVCKFDDVGGLNEQLCFIRNCLEIFLHFENNAQSAVLMLTGPSGIGKSLVLRAICDEYNVHTEFICWYEILCSQEPEIGIKKLTSAFETAVKREPSIIIIDEFDYLCPGKNGSFKGNNHHLISKTLSTMIEKLPMNKKVLIAAASNTDFNDSILNISGKLYNEVKFSVPSAAERKEIFEKILCKRGHTLTQEQITELSISAHGFTGKDFLCVLKEAETFSFQKQLKQDFVIKDFKSCPLEYHDIVKYMRQRKNTVVECVKSDKVHWCDIGGMLGVKEKLKQVIEWPLKQPEVLKRYGISPSRGVLMYGPPGCSKTMIAKALANECGLNFIAKKSSDLFNKWVGESEKAVRDLFAQARAAAPCVIFFDEIDALVAERGTGSGGSGVGDRIVTSLLTEIDGIEELHGIVIVAATNRPDMLDDALTRNGRINHFIYVPLPDENTREEIFKIQMKCRTLSNDVDIKQLVEKTQGYTGAEVVNICNEAAMNLLIEDPTVTSAVFKMHHFENALKAVLPRTTREMLEFYEKYNSIFLSNK